MIEIHILFLHHLCRINVSVQKLHHLIGIDRLAYPFAVHDHHPAGDAHNSSIGRHRFQHHGTCAYLGMVSHRKGAQYLGA